jgi:hypothetical protein
MTDMQKMAAMWLVHKEAERVAVEARRKLEDMMADALAIDEATEGSTTAKLDEYTVKIVSRIDRKVDADLLQDVAAEAGLSEHLASLFRWKPEINAAAWKAADKEITAALAPAITAKPGRPSFSITPVETKE